MATSPFLVSSGLTERIGGGGIDSIRFGNGIWKLIGQKSRYQKR